MSGPTKDKTCSHPLGIVCPKCSGEMRVWDTRRSSGAAFVIRRRRCVKCSTKVVTREIIIKFPR